MNRNPHPVDIQVGNKVRIARAVKGYSQEKLAHILGISFQQVQKYEKGTNRISCSRLWEISKALDHPMAWFFDESDGSGGIFEVTNLTIKLASEIANIKDDDIRSGVLKVISGAEKKD